MMMKNKRRLAKYISDNIDCIDCNYETILDLLVQFEEEIESEKEFASDMLKQIN